MKAFCVAALLLLTACMDDAPDPNDPFGRTPAEIEAERAECVASGGEFRPGGLLGLACFTTTGDGGKACTSADACEGPCIVDDDASVGACAAETPVFGCFGMFGSDGQRAVLCVD